MLYEFHQNQNAKKPGTVHATYLLAGTKSKEINGTDGAQKDGEDEYMQSSPFVSSSMPQPTEETEEISVLSVSLVKEEDLESEYNPHLNA
jgi:DNA polymerase delta subunit 3